MPGYSIVLLKRPPVTGTAIMQYAILLNPSPICVEVRDYLERRGHKPTMNGLDLTTEEPLTRRDKAVIRGIGKGYNWPLRVIAGTRAQRAVDYYARRVHRVVPDAEIYYDPTLGKILTVVPGATGDLNKDPLHGVYNAELYTRQRFASPFEFLAVQRRLLTPENIAAIRNKWIPDGQIYRSISISR